MSEKKATLRRIARETGFSLGTVSQAINNKYGVAPETRQRVMEVAASLNYRPKRAPEQKTLSTIGVLVKIGTTRGLLRLNDFYSHVLMGIERECNKRNITLMYSNIEVDDEARPTQWPPRILEQDVDGLIVVGPSFQNSLDILGRYQNRPVVFVDAYLANNPFDSIEIDSLNGAFTAVSHLIEQGHRHIGLIGSNADSHPSILQRRDGYLRALRYYGIPRSYIWDTPLDRQVAQQAIIDLKRKHPEVTAVFACNDDVAIGVLNGARANGISVPHDLSLVGFDDVDAAQEATPPLTTMRVDKAFMGMVAVRQLIDYAENGNRPGLIVGLRTQLIIRESVARLSET